MSYSGLIKFCMAFIMVFSLSVVVVYLTNVIYEELKKN